jgi:hypothetical protein
MPIHICKNCVMVVLVRSSAVFPQDNIHESWKLKTTTLKTTLNQPKCEIGFSTGTFEGLRLVLFL